MSKMYNKNEYLPTGFPGLKQNKKDKALFFFDFRVNGKRYRKFHREKATNHTAKDYVLNAAVVLKKYKEQVDGIDSSNLTLNDYFYNFMQRMKKSDWNIKRVQNYNRYIGSCTLYGCKVEENTPYKKVKVGDKPVQKITSKDIENIIVKMDHLKLCDRTKNSIFEVLNPLYKWMLKHHYVQENIAQYNKVKITLKDQKKKVINADIKLKELYQAVCKVYADDPFYRAMFLFFIYGRRKMEVLKLKWSEINLDSDEYILIDPKGHDHQTFKLPKEIKEALLQIPYNKKGYVFKSTKRQGQHIKYIDRQVAKINKILSFKLTIHYSRHILVTALSNQNVNKPILSAVLGHTDLQSINRYITPDYKNAGMITIPIIEEVLQVA